MSNFNQQWSDMLSTFEMENVPWGLGAGLEWMSCKQFDENEYRVQIFTQVKFEEYKRRKDTIVELFKQIDFQLVNEACVKDIPFVYWKELCFFSYKKVQEIEQKERAMLNHNIGSIYAPGGVVNIDTIMLSSPIAIDNQVQNIENQIEQFGGDDKEELQQFLRETKELLNKCSEQKQILSKPGFLKQLNTHVVKHSWFYGAILQLIGAVAIQMIG